MRRLIIFDCDGVLVDSEIIVAHRFVSELKTIGIEINEQDSLRKFLGKSVPTIYAEIQQDFGVSISQEVIDRIQGNIQLALRDEVQAIEGMSGLLEELEGTPSLDRCVASSGSFERIYNSLNVSKLAASFRQKSIFSAQQVRCGKPAPDLFLYAAQQMGFLPEECLVIEDSPAGIEAAQAAQMAVIGFTGGSHAQFIWYREKLKTYEVPIAKSAEDLRRYLRL